MFGIHHSSPNGEGRLSQGASKQVHHALPLPPSTHVIAAPVSAMRLDHLYGLLQAPQWLQHPLTLIANPAPTAFDWNNVLIEPRRSDASKTTDP